MSDELELTAEEEKAMTKRQIFFLHMRQVAELRVLIDLGYGENKSDVARRALDEAYERLLAAENATSAGR